MNLLSLKHVNKLRFKSWKSVGQFLLTEHKLWFLWSYFQHLENRKVPVSGQSVLRGPFLEILENASNIRTNWMILLRCRTCAKEQWAIELNEQLEISSWRISRSRLRIWCYDQECLVVLEQEYDQKSHIEGQLI